MTAEATGKRETRKLYCVLTQPEFNVRATEYATADQELDTLEAERKTVNEDYKDRIGGVNAKRGKLRRIVIERREPRDVQCTWHADWASKSMLLRRDDTGEVVQARTMTPEEVQSSFEFTDGDKRLPPSGEDNETLT